VSVSRRTLLRGAAGAVACAAARPIFSAQPGLPPVRAITRGPRFHWFGYYDKLQFDPTGRFVLSMQVDFEHRSPAADDVIRIGMIDTAAGDAWTELGSSSAWGWQQGCMLQWVPGSDRLVLWNDRQEGRFVCHVLDVRSRQRRTIASPIYTLSPDARTAVTPDFSRIQDVRPGYGYAGIPDPYGACQAPPDTGIFRVDLRTGQRQLILSLARVLSFGPQLQTMENARHWFNHLLYNTDGSRFVFLHRWRPAGAGMNTFHTRMISATPDGHDLHVVDPSGHMSHFIWRDSQHLLGWTRPAGKNWGFYLLKDKSDQVEQVGAGVMTENGHCTYLPGNQWILNDTYPDRTRREQHVYLYHVPTGRRVPLGSFHSPPAYAGEWRCDTHPRFSPDGTRVTIDSPHAGAGRQVHLIDISSIVADR
jgi:hypothetical protein